MNLLREFSRLKYGAGSLPHGKGGSSNAPPPDPNVGKAEQQMADLSQQEFQYYQNSVAPELQQEYQQTNQQEQQYINQYIQNSQQANQQAKGYYDEYQNTYVPLMNQMVDQAKNYDSEGNFEQQAQLAIGDVDAVGNAQQQSQAMQMKQYGIDPTSGAYQGMWNANGVNQASQEAAAATRARTAAQQLGWNMETQAASMGQGLPGASAQEQAISQSNTGGAMSGTQQQQSNNQASANAQTQGYQTAIGNYGTLGNMANTNTQNQNNAWSASQQASAQSSAGLGSALGGLAMGAAMMF